MTEYIATQSNVHYGSGATGDPTHIAGTYPNWTSDSSVDFSGDFSGLNITGFKLVFDASEGDGYMFWDLFINNPGWISDPTWTADAVSHIGTNNSYDGEASGIRVNGPTHYEHVFYWPGDPAFGGFVFVDPVSDLLISLATPGSWVNADLEVGGSAPPAAPIVVTRFDLVLLTRTPQSTMRKHPNSTGLGVGPARHWPKPRRGISGIR